MTHLSNTELVDLLDGRLDGDRLQHADTCEACRARVGDLRSVLDDASAVRVPEPSPLFWPHLAARVMEGIRAEETGRYAWLRLGPQAWAAVAVLVVVVGVAGIVTFRSTTADLAPTGAARAGLNAGDVDLLLDADNDLNADEAWAIVRTLADEVNWGEADAHEAGIAPGPGWANRAALSLNAAELYELARLLETELQRRKGV